jgi:glycosyltransferase involved in cell wall biosynthesis
MTSAGLRVSVVIPAYNAAHFLGEAIASIRSQQRQPDEIIVVDDGSTDQTAAVARSWLRYPRSATARNLGPAAATAAPSKLRAAP